MKQVILFILLLPGIVHAEDRLMSWKEAIYSGKMYSAKTEQERIMYRNALIANAPERAAEFGMKPLETFSLQEIRSIARSFPETETKAPVINTHTTFSPRLQAIIASPPRPVYYMPPAPIMTVQHVAVMQPPVEPGPVRSYYDEYYADQIKAEVEHAKEMALLEQRQQERQSTAPREAVVIVTEAADSSAAHIEMQTRNARTTASIPNAMTATQQDTIAQLAAYQLKIDQQAAKLEQQRQEFLHLQTVLVLAVLGSIPLLAALYWTGKQAMYEWRAIQDLRHRQKLEESQAVQKELQAAEHLIEKR